MYIKTTVYLYAKDLNLKSFFYTFDSFCKAFWGSHRGVVGAFDPPPPHWETQSNFFASLQKNIYKNKTLKIGLKTVENVNKT